jgi:hypothetical protein
MDEDAYELADQTRARRVREPYDVAEAIGFIKDESMKSTITACDGGLVYKIKNNSSSTLL